MYSDANASGQMYFDSFKLPEQSLYKRTEVINASRAQGIDQPHRAKMVEYAATAVDKIASHTIGRFWCGNNAGSTRMNRTATEVPQDVTSSPNYFFIFVMI